VESEAEAHLGLTDEINDARQFACEFSGAKQSQIARQSILERLVRHPGQRLAAAMAAKQQSA
jgi:hypothetical protein